jgi:hypothetical protein
LDHEPARVVGFPADEIAEPEEGDRQTGRHERLNERASAKRDGDADASSRRPAGDVPANDVELSVARRRRSPARCRRQLRVDRPEAPDEGEGELVRVRPLASGRHARSSG